jgi:hypothetical protein
MSISICIKEIVQQLARMVSTKFEKKIILRILKIRDGL